MKRPSPPVYIALLLALCAALVGWHYAARRSGGVSLPESAAFLVLRGVQRPLSVVGDWVSDVGRAIVGRGGVIAENERLRGEVADLRGQNQRLMRYRRDNDELRKLLGMKPPRGGKSIAADITSLDAFDYARRVHLNVGAAQGVKPKDVVFVAEGVVGQVVAVAPLKCEVLLLTDREARVGAVTQRGARGVVQGTGDPVCKMAYLNFNADVREGDLVYTSGESEIFPKGLVIGQVLKARRDKGYSRLTAFIEPAVSFDRLSVVYVRVGA